MSFDFENLKEIPDKIGGSLKKNPMLIGGALILILALILLKNKSSASTTESTNDSVSTSSGYTSADGYSYPNGSGGTGGGIADSTSEIYGQMADMVNSSNQANVDNMNSLYDKITQQQETNNGIIQQQIDAINQKTDALNDNSSLYTGVVPSTQNGSFTDQYVTNNYNIDKATFTGTGTKVETKSTSQKTMAKTNTSIGKADDKTQVLTMTPTTKEKANTIVKPVQKPTPVKASEPVYASMDKAPNTSQTYMGMNKEKATSSISQNVGSQKGAINDIVNKQHSNLANMGSQMFNKSTPSTPKKETPVVSKPKADPVVKSPVSKPSPSPSKKGKK
jgi:hypothetical protein